jgi:hypothetical protein
MQTARALRALCCRHWFQRPRVWRTPTPRSKLAFNRLASLCLRCCASSQVAGSILGKHCREHSACANAAWKHCRETSSREHPHSCGGRELAPRLFAGSIRKSNRGGLCITRQSTPTPKGVRSLRSHLFLGAGYFYVRAHGKQVTHLAGATQGCERVGCVDNCSRGRLRGAFAFASA